MNKKEVLTCDSHGWTLGEFVSQDDTGVIFSADCGCTIGPVRLFVEVSPGVVKIAKYQIKKTEVEK